MRAKAQKRPAKPTRKLRAAKEPRRTARRGRRVDPAARKKAILDAALTVFAERGFGAARLDDVAARAGVAKGTLYLYFKDKETLFEEVVRGVVSPVLERVSALASAPDMPFDKALEALFSMFEREVLGTKRKLLIRLVITEGPRFPRIAELHYRNVVARIMPLIQKLARRPAARGEVASEAIARYPQLIAAPLLTVVVWDALFAKIEPLDVAGFLRAYRRLLTAKPRRSAS